MRERDAYQSRDDKVEAAEETHALETDHVVGEEVSDGADEVEAERRRRDWSSL